MTIANSKKIFYLKRIKEIMYCDFQVNRKEFLSMDAKELKLFIDENLLTNSIKGFVVNKYFRCSGDENIETSIRYIEDEKEPDEINKENFRVRIFEELENTNATILLDNNVKNLDLIINGEGYLEDIKDCAYEEPESFYTFFENMISFSCGDQKINWQIDSESYGKSRHKYIIIDSKIGGSGIDLINEKIDDYIADFKYL